MPCILCVNLSASGKLALYGSEDAGMQKWDTSTGKDLGPPIAANTVVSVAEIGKDCTLIVTGSFDGIVLR